MKGNVRDARGVAVSLATATLPLSNVVVKSDMAAGKGTAVALQPKPISNMAML